MSVELDPIPLSQAGDLGAADGGHGHISVGRAEEARRVGGQGVGLACGPNDAARIQQDVHGPQS